MTPPALAAPIFLSSSFSAAAHSLQSPDFVIIVIDITSSFPFSPGEAQRETSYGGYQRRRHHRFQGFALHCSPPRRPIGPPSARRPQDPEDAEGPALARVPVPLH
ncbi:hypothetical protein F5X99DRAFT_425564 [Biscogniauxia marginata]|nr:hypothetical protein F5X99DRAFT_425564 [Biscogniauxia marginata]